MSKEDINNLKEMLVDFNEYSTDYTKTRCKELEKTVENTLNEIDRLNNIIDELEKWIKENNLGKYRTENVVDIEYVKWNSR